MKDATGERRCSESDPAVAATDRPKGRLWLRVAKEHPTVAAFALLLAATALMRLGWGYQLSTEIRVLERGIIERGEVLSESELPPMPSVSESEDAVVLYRNAAAVDMQSSPGWTTLQYPSYPPFGDAWQKAAASSEQSNPQVFRLAREARSRPKGRFSRERSGTAMREWLDSVRDYTVVTEVARTVRDGAIYKHLAGDDLEAVERLLDVQHMAFIAAQDRSSMGKLTGTGIAALNAQAIHVVAPGLRFENPLVQERVRRLIAALLDTEQDGSDELKRMFERERIFEPQAWSEVADAWVLRPLSLRKQLDALHAHASADQALRYDNWPAMDRVLDQRFDDHDPPAWLLALTPKAATRDLARSDELGDDYNRWHRNFFIFQFGSIGEMRAAAVSLAAQLYRQDHQGRWPTSLNELTPAYLPVLPPDPFHEDGRPIGYTVLRGGLPDGGDRPLVSFDAGETAEGAIDNEPMVEWKSRATSGSPRRTVHQYRDLARWMPKERRFDREMKELREANEALNNPPPAEE